MQSTTSSNRPTFVRAAVVVILALTCIVILGSYLEAQTIKPWWLPMAVNGSVIRLGWMLKVWAPDKHLAPGKSQGSDPFVWPPKNHGFQPLNINNVYSFWNVCIEPREQPIKLDISVLGTKYFYNDTQKIVVYNRGNRTGLQKISYISKTLFWRWRTNWDVEFRNESIPLNHSFVNSTVFFMPIWSIGNFYHFFTDGFVPLFELVKRTNLLRPGVENQILYQKSFYAPNGLTSTDNNMTRYQDFLFTLYTRKFHDAYFRVPPNTCYVGGVMGFLEPPAKPQPRAPVEHVLQSFNIRSPPRNDCFVTFVQRNRRTILNMAELTATAQALGFKHVRVVHFGRIPVRQQMEIASSSRVMVGVNGAGLQWSVFMPNGSHLIEFVWKWFGKIFGEYVTPYGISCQNLLIPDDKVFVNWTSYEKTFRFGKIVPPEERAKLLALPGPVNLYLDNIYKEADVIVDKEALRKMLSKLL